MEKPRISRGGGLVIPAQQPLSSREVRLHDPSEDEQSRCRGILFDEAAGPSAAPLPPLHFRAGVPSESDRTGFGPTVYPMRPDSVRPYIRCGRISASGRQASDSASGCPRACPRASGSGLPLGLGIGIGPRDRDRASTSTRANRRNVVSPVILFRFVRV
jgi:hypothetical protein